MFCTIVEGLAKHGFVRMVAQCRDKVKALKKKYKAIKDGMRKSGTGQESDEESDRLVDFPYYDVLDSVMGGRAAVVPVHLLDSTSDNPATTEADGEVNAFTVTECQPTTPSPSASSQPTAPSPSTGGSQPTAPTPSSSSHLVSTHPLSDDDT